MAQKNTFQKKTRRKITIRDIADHVGVSIGTVDRVLHNRGRVSEQTRQRILSFVKENGYKSNLHASAAAIRNSYNIVATLPAAPKGSYWWSVWNGINKAIGEYDDLHLNVNFLSYSPFDLYSCQATFARVPMEECDAVIIGTIFSDETKKLCQALDKIGKPYFFMDSFVEGVNPVATFSVHQHSGGMLAARLLHKMSSNNGKFILFESSRVGNQWSLNSMARKEGFVHYFKNLGQEDRIEVATFSPNDPEQNDKTIRALLSEEMPLAGAAAMNSHGYAVARLLRQHFKSHVLLAAFDATEQNCEELRRGGIDVLLCQRPEMQGYQVTLAAIRHLVYKQRDHESLHLLPIDILLPESLPYYREIFNV